MSSQHHYGEPEEDGSRSCWACGAEKDTLRAGKSCTGTNSQKDTEAWARPDSRFTVPDGSFTVPSLDLCGGSGKGPYADDD